MLKHPAITILRIEQFVMRMLTHARSKRVPLQVEVAGPVARITHAEAMRLTYKPVRKEMVLGPLWATFWFRVRGNVPKEWRNSPVDLLFHGESEALVWRDGAPLQGMNFENEPPFRDGGRTDARVPVDMIRSGKVDLRVEAACNGLNGSNSIDRYTFTGAELALFDQEAWDLFHDLFVPMQYIRAIVVENRPGQPWLGHKVEGNLSVWHGYLMDKLNEICNCTDTEDRSTWKNMRPILREIYSHKNATRAHEMSAIGHSHIDTAWLWPTSETKRKCARSFSTVLRYMDRYPNYKFACSQAQQYEWMKEFYPTVFAGIKKAVKRGQWVPVGGTWIEPDCNITGGESLVRQILYGKRYFRKEFGVNCEELWNPDVFGYSGALPQIIRKSGMKYFLTQKLTWSQFNKPRHQNFLWRGIDGTEVLTHFPPAATYNAMMSSAVVKDLLIHEENMQDHDRTNEGYLLYGYGDGGGGPTLHMLEVLDRVKDLQGFPRTKQRGAKEFFERLEKSLTSIPIVEGELYLEIHRATYTTRGASKKNNRRSEFLLRNIEMLSSVAAASGAQKYPSDALYGMWKLVMLNQFHDILPGTSIPEVFVDSDREYAEVFATGENLEKRAVTALTKGKSSAGYSVINTCGWERAGLVELPGNAGNQKTWRGTSLSEAAAPSCGMAPVEAPESPEFSVHVEKKGTKFILENSFLRAEFSEAGTLTSLKDKVTGRIVSDPKAPGNQFVFFEDYPIDFDAWDADITHLETRKTIPPAHQARIIEKGPLRAGLEFRFRFGKSSIVQQVFLENKGRRLDFDCEVDWHHRKRFLKIEFPVAVKSPEATFEIQFGFLTRPTHLSSSYDMARYEVSAQRWIDLSESGYGAAIFTDSKYGYAVHGNVMRISLLRGPVAPHPTVDIGKNQFRFALYPHEGTLQEAEVVRRAYEFNNPWIVTPGRVKAQSWFSVDSPHLVIDTVKKAEDSNDIVVRLYESNGARGRATLHSGLPVRSASLANLLEEPERKIRVVKNSVSLDFKPFELITVILKQ